MERHRWLNIASSRKRALSRQLRESLTAEVVDRGACLALVEEMRLLTNLIDHESQRERQRQMENRSPGRRLERMPRRPEFDWDDAELFLSAADRVLNGFTLLVVVDRVASTDDDARAVEQALLDPSFGPALFQAMELREPGDVEGYTTYVPPEASDIRVRPEAAPRTRLEDMLRGAGRYWSPYRQEMPRDYVEAMVTAFEGSIPPAPRSWFDVNADVLASTGYLDGFDDAILVAVWSRWLAFLISNGSD